MNKDIPYFFYIYYYYQIIDFQRHFIKHLNYYLEQHTFEGKIIGFLTTLSIVELQLELQIGTVGKTYSYSCCSYS